MTARLKLNSCVTRGLLAIVILSSGVYYARQSGVDPLVYSNDFNVYYHAASEVMAGRDPYQHSLSPGTPYLYPPLLSELMLPFALLPLPVAAYVWFLISVASFAYAARMSAALCDQQRESLPRTTLIAAIASVLLIRFAMDNFNMGQVNTIVAALSVAHVYFYAKDKKGLSAVAFALAASIKLTPIILIAYHVAKLRLKFAALCLSLLAVVTVLSFLPFKPREAETFKVFFNRTVKNEQGFDLAFAGNQSLRGTVARFLEDKDNAESTREPTSAVTLIISIALVAFAMFAAATARSDLAASAPFFCCFVILSPLSWKAHFVVLILPVVYLICRALQTSETRRGYLVATLVAVFALFNLTSPKVVGPRGGEWTDAHSMVFAGAMLIFIACVWRAPRRFVNLNQSD